MFINRVAARLGRSQELAATRRTLAAGDDATIAVAQGARPLVLATLWALDPRPCLYVVAGEEHADRVARTLGAWIGAEMVCRYPARADMPWSSVKPDDAMQHTVKEN